VNEETVNVRYMVDDVEAAIDFYTNLWGALTRFHAARLYSWRSPPRRSRRSIPADAGEETVLCVRALGWGGSRLSERCGPWLL
jgi:catechol 2,3-dioxygenase-like lactoylglutathione lyase family enzyme